MKIRALCLAAALAGAVGAVSSSAAVYTFDSGLPAVPKDAPTLDPQTARLIFARRLGVSQYHSVQHLHQDALQQIVRYSGRQRSLFEDIEEEDELRKQLVIVEGVKDVHDVIQGHPSYFIAPPPDSTTNAELARTLSEQIEDDVSSVIHLTSLQQLQGAAYKEEAAQVSAMLASLALNAKEGRQASVVVLFPVTDPNSKRSLPPSYGDLSFKRQTTEKPLEVSPPSEGSTSSSALDGTATSTSTVSSSSSGTANITHPLPTKGPLPVCYGTADSCNESTNRCSGHGRCLEKYKTKPLDDELPKSCWACECGTTVVSPDSTDGNKGKKTIYWGGAACQKKDVSGPFFLLIAVTIALVGAITWGVGLLFSVGQEDLPSVIGAGISGKTPK